MVGAICLVVLLGYVTGRSIGPPAPAQLQADAGAEGVDEVEQALRQTPDATVLESGDAGPGEAATVRPPTPTARREQARPTRASVTPPAPAAGSGTKQYFYEAAAYLLAIESSGIGIEDVHPNKAVVTNGALPIDSEFTCSLGHGMVGITRKEANQIIKRLMETYEGGIKNPPRGRTLDECYDILTMRPDEELKKTYDEAISELRELGIRFK